MAVVHAYLSGWVVSLGRAVPYVHVCGPSFVWRFFVWTPSRLMDDGIGTDGGLVGRVG